jgi:hypothetical protein
MSPVADLRWFFSLSKPALGLLFSPFSVQRADFTP